MKSNFETGSGKGNQERAVNASNGGLAHVRARTAVPGYEPGPFLAPVNKGSRVGHGRGLSAQVLAQRLRVRAARAKIARCSPHGLRRSFVSHALANSAELTMVQSLAGHASPTTTARYDRRPEEARRCAAELVHVPFADRAGEPQ